MAARYLVTPPTLDEITRAALAMGLILLTAGIVVPMQFLRRQTVWARGLVGVAAVMAPDFIPYFGGCAGR